MALVIQRNTHTHTDTDIKTHTNFLDKSNFKKPSAHWPLTDVWLVYKGSRNCNKRKETCSQLEMTVIHHPVSATVIVQNILYSGKFSEINIFRYYNEHRISEIKFWNLVYLLQILPYYNYW